MTSFVFDIGEMARSVALFVGDVRSELQRALIHEKKTRKLTQQRLATLIGVNRSVINRQIMGFENLTIRRVAELAWALGWEIDFSLRKANESVPAKVAHVKPNDGTVTVPASALYTNSALLNTNAALLTPPTLLNINRIESNGNYPLVSMAA